MFILSSVLEIGETGQAFACWLVDRERKLPRNSGHKIESGGAVLVAMMEVTDLRQFHYSTAFWGLDLAGLWQVFSEREMGSRALVVSKVAVYEQGMLRPLEPLSLDENQHVTVVISTDEDPLAPLVDRAFLERARQEVQALTSIQSLDEVQRILAKIPDSLSKDAETERRDRILSGKPPWAQGVGDSNLLAPTNNFKQMRTIFGPQIL